MSNNFAQLQASNSTYLPQHVTHKHYRLIFTTYIRLLAQAIQKMG